jgi:hypothetical protein
MRNAYKVLAWNPEGKEDFLGDLYVDPEITLKLKSAL